MDVNETFTGIKIFEAIYVTILHLGQLMWLINKFDSFNYLWRSSGKEAEEAGIFTFSYVCRI